MHVKVYKCFIASPGDTDIERSKCDDVLNKINITLGETKGFRVESKKWEINAHPSFGKDGQDVINTQLLKDYDIFIGIMWAKFGSPTARAGSGTEEEFDQAYSRYRSGGNVEIMMYFNKSDVPMNAIDPSQISKVKTFKTKIADLGGLYKEYDGPQDFENVLYENLFHYFSKENINSKTPNEISASPAEILEEPTETKLENHVRVILENRLDDSLRLFSKQPAIWVDPVICTSEMLPDNLNDACKETVSIDEIIKNPRSIIIKSPPQFGLTSLSHHLILEAWKQQKIWIRLTSSTTKPDNIERSVAKEINSLGLFEQKVDCIILDSWKATEPGSKKLLRNLCRNFPNTPIILMKTTEELPFNEENDNDQKIERSFEKMHLLALPRNKVRKVVSDYNDARSIGDENRLLEKVLRELDALNIHRTPLNCITLLKVSEHNIDDSPVNRTKMIELVLFALFNLDEIPTYKSKPDLKDCEYALGMFCENLIRAKRQEFTREEFLDSTKLFCKEKLLHIEVEVVFDTLFKNNILSNSEGTFRFRSTYWIYYFAARRMYHNEEFKNFIINDQNYNSFPEIIEFYTGIDRDRGDLIIKLTTDLAEACDIVEEKTGIPSEFNLLEMISWNPTEESLASARRIINEEISSSKLPESLRDDFADQSYNQMRPYDQNINYIFKEYSLHILIQKIKASSRALRNSDYVEPNIKRNLLKTITRGWKQVSQILFALTPTLATQGMAVYDGSGFELSGDFGDTIEERIKRIILANPHNVVKMFSEDIYSNKIAPLIYDGIENENDSLIKHNLILMLIYQRPTDWKKQLEKYISELPKNSFYLQNSISSLDGQFRYSFASNNELNEIKYLLKCGYAKHRFGKKPTAPDIAKISNKFIPKRECPED